MVEKAGESSVFWLEIDYIIGCMTSIVTPVMRPGMMQTTYKTVWVMR